MTIKEQLEQRAQSRAKCRAVADKIVSLILKELDTIEEPLQAQTLNMVASEIQLAVRKGGT